MKDRLVLSLRESQQSQAETDKSDVEEMFRMHDELLEKAEALIDAATTPTDPPPPTGAAENSHDPDEQVTTRKTIAILAATGQVILTANEGGTPATLYQRHVDKREAARLALALFEYISLNDRIFAQIDAIRLARHHLAITAAGDMPF